MGGIRTEITSAIGVSLSASANSVGQEGALSAVVSGEVVKHFNLLTALSLGRSKALQSTATAAATTSTMMICLFVCFIA